MDAIRFRGSKEEEDRALGMTGGALTRARYALEGVGSRLWDCSLCYGIPSRWVTEASPTSRVLFVSAGGERVNAHADMAGEPEAVDGGRLFEYLASKGIRALRLNGSVHPVSHVEMSRPLADMAASGRLCAVDTEGAWPHRVYRLPCSASAGDGSGGRG